MSDYAEVILQWAQQAYERGQHAEAETLLRPLQGDPVEAEFLLRSATELDGLHARAHDEPGQALEKPGRHDEARESRMCAMELDPELAKLRMVKSFEALHKGDHATLWEEYESRVIAAPGVIPKRKFPRPRWYGNTDISGKTILLHAEQGHGDVIQFLRYIPLVAARGARIVVEIHRPLRPFVAAMSEVAELRELGEPLPDFDVHCPLMSLPLAFQTTLETIPADIPYLQVPSDRMARWRRRLGFAPAPARGHRLVGQSGFRRRYETVDPTGRFCPHPRPSGLRSARNPERRAEARQGTAGWADTSVGSLHAGR